MNKNELEQKKLEESYKQQQNFFYETISEKLVYIKDREEKFSNILFEIDKEKDLTLDQFELIGCLSYIVGIDYTNQLFLKENICNNVKERFLKFDFSKDFLINYAFALDKITEQNCLKAKDELKNKFDSIISIKTEEKLLFNNIRLLIKSIINNSIIPINMVVGINEIIVKSEYTYQDIIKINSLINRQCKFNGSKAIKSMIKLYSDIFWQKLLTKASKLFDNQKFAVVYLDGILSVIEANKKFKNDLFDIIINDGTINYAWETIEENYNNNIPKIIPEEVIEDLSKEKYSRLPTDIISNLQENLPFSFILNVMSDLLGYFPKTTEDVLQGIDKIFEQTDYYQNVYHYLKANLKKLSKQTLIYDLNIDEIIVELTKIIETLGIEYKNLMEKSCEDIPVDIKQKIVEYVNTCIDNLLLVNDEQKQYLISQIIENNITTYQHLQQIITLIETCDINGSNLLTYVDLNKFLITNTNISEIFEMFEKIEPLQSKLSFVAGFGDFFKALNSEPIKETDISTK